MRAPVHQPGRVLAIPRLERIDEVDEAVGRIDHIEPGIGPCRHIAQLFPGPVALIDRLGGQEPRRPVDPIAQDERRRLLFGKGGVHLLGDPLAHIHRRVVQKGLRRRRHGVEFGGGEGQLVDHLRTGLAARRRLAHPADLRSGHRDRFLVDRARHLPHTADRPHGRNRRQKLGDFGFGLRRHQIAAIGVRSHRERLFLAALHIGRKRVLVLVSLDAPTALERWTRLFHRHPIERRFVPIENGIEPIELAIEQRIGAPTFFQFTEALIVGGFELLERRHELGKERIDVPANRHRRRLVLKARFNSLGHRFSLCFLDC